MRSWLFRGRKLDCKWKLGCVKRIVGWLFVDHSQHIHSSARDHNHI